jgi:UDP-N-acetyl-D-mannosaminuronate dehydrogenase
MEFPMDEIFDGRVAVIGLGYIGLPTAVALATRGVEVIGVDVNEATVEAVAHGQVPFVEPDLGQWCRLDGQADSDDRDPPCGRLHHRGADAVHGRAHA